MPVNFNCGIEVNKTYNVSGTVNSTMGSADTAFINTCRDILENGTWVRDERVRPKWEDGTPAYTIKKFGVVNRYDLSKEFPLEQRPTQDTSSNEINQKMLKVPLPFLSYIHLHQYKQQDVL